MHASQTAYLTVINWPNSFSEADRVDALVGAAAMDPYQATQASRRNLPGVMCTINALDCGLILESMHARGILCIAPTHDEVMSYAPPIGAASVKQFTGTNPARFEAQPLDGTPWSFGADEVKMVVSGHVKGVKVKLLEQSSPTSMHHANVKDYGVRASRSISVTPLLDLHIRPNRSGQPDQPIQIVRLMGPRSTRIGIVGDDAPPSLLDNARPHEMAQILMPNAHIDQEFHDFDPPIWVRRMTAKAGGRNGSLSLESWAFYSPWLGIIKQSMYGW